MKVGIDARFLTHPQRGGFKTYTSSVVSSLVEAGSDCRFVLYTDRPLRQRAPLPANFSVSPVTGRNAVIREQLLLPAVMERDEIDAAHFLCNTAPILFHRTMVVTIHDTIALREKPDRSTCMNRRQRLLRSYWRAVIPRCARRADLVITDSGYVRDDLHARLGIPAEKLRVVPLPIDPAFSQESSGCPPAGIAPGSSFILAFASADGRKNHATAIDAYDVVAPEFPNLKLALVCSHPQVRDGIKRPHDSGVIPVGPVSFQELIWLYRNALALVFPSFDEGFGLPPLEAMACGTPVVVSKAGSLPEVAGDCAVFADPCDAAAVAEGLKLVLMDGDLRSGLVSAGREHAARFSRENVGRELIAAYSQAASGVPASPAPA